MSGLLEDLLCGAIGYSLGKRSQDRFQNICPDFDEKAVILKFLKSCDIDEILTAWMKANNIPDNDWFTATSLRARSDAMKY